MNPLSLTQGSAAVLAATAAIIDWRTLRLPHVLTLPAAALAIFGQGNFGGGWMNALAGAGGGFLILKGAQLFSRMRSGEDGIGSGDAILMLSLGALLGPALLPWGVCASCALAFTAVKILPVAAQRGIGNGLSAHFWWPVAWEHGSGSFNSSESDEPQCCLFVFREDFYPLSDIFIPQQMEQSNCQTPECRQNLSLIPA